MPSSLAVLPPPALGFSPRPPVSACGTGPAQAIAAFPGGGAALFATASSLCRAFHSRLAPSRRVPACSAAPGCRNLRLLPFGCASRPPLRSRLSRGRSALPRNPWTFGPEDSRLRLATHSGILPSRASTVPSGTASAAAGMLPYHAPLRGHPRLRRRVSAPDIFGAGTLGQWAVTHSLNAWLLLGQHPGCL